MGRGLRLGQGFPRRGWPLPRHRAPSLPIGPAPPAPGAAKWEGVGPFAQGDPWAGTSRSGASL